MSMSEWAKNEIELAESMLKEEDEDIYVKLCYESAFRAYSALIEDGYSGMSWAITGNILKRLIDGNPLTPIENTDDIWKLVSDREGIKKYQCTRRSALFKTVKSDGKELYRDVERFRFIDLNSLSSEVYHNGFLSGIMHEMYPIVFPYDPVKEMKKIPHTIITKSFCLDAKNGDFDTVALLHEYDNNHRKQINRYFAFDGPEPREISYAEFAEREEKKLFQNMKKFKQIKEISK